MTKTNETLNTNEPQENSFFQREDYAFSAKPKNYSRRWKHTKPDLLEQCLICDSQITIKYILPRQVYSQKNNWGYWTGKPTDQNKYFCNTCLKKILNGKKFDVNDWVDDENKANTFRTYFARGDFN